MLTPSKLYIKSKFFLPLGLWGVTIFLSIFSPIQSLARPSTAIIKDSPKEVIDQVWQIIYRDFLDSSGKYDREEWLQVRKKILSHQYIDKYESYDAIRKMLADLDDPYTRFLDPKAFKEMRIDTSGELTGVGIQLSKDKETKELIIISPIEGTPAFRAGVRPTDVIISIDGVSTKGMNIEDAVKLIRGKKGTEVILGIRRKSDLISIPLIRDRISIHVVDSQMNKSSTGVKIGYIRLKQFNANATKEMRNAINRLESLNALGYVLDLRSNPGGLLEASVAIARQWLDEGIIVSTQTRDGIKDVRKANGTALTNRPVVVLVNEGSASASEILSGAIQDNNRGILIGKKTFGKGLVQSVRGLSDGSGLTVTIAKYLTPKGTDIHLNGINPDIIAELQDDGQQQLTIDDLGTINDSQYRIAEYTLLKYLAKDDTVHFFNPRSSNLISALALLE